MRILALETTEAVGTVAAMCDGKLLTELTLEPTLRSAQSLAPAMKALLERVGWHATDVDLVAVTVGPGSFTGLRVGVTAAKTFAYAAQADVLGLDTLEVIAAGVPEDIDLISTAVDAQRGDVVAALFTRGDDGLLRRAPGVSPGIERRRLRTQHPRANARGSPDARGSPNAQARLTPGAQPISIDSWLSELPGGTWLSGPVLKKLADRVPETLRIGGLTFLGTAGIDRCPAGSP